MVKWGAIEGDPLLGAMRVVRTLGKVGMKTPDPATMEHLRRLISGVTCVQNRLQVVRNLLKLLGDKDFAHEVRSLWSAGFFAKWQPSLHRALAPFDAPRLASLVKQCADAACRLNSVIRLTSPQEQVKIFEDVKLVDPELVPVAH